MSTQIISQNSSQHLGNLLTTTMMNHGWQISPLRLPSEERRKRAKSTPLPTENGFWLDFSEEHMTEELNRQESISARTIILRRKSLLTNHATL